jgi:hypothetical protein
MMRADAGLHADQALRTTWNEFLPISMPITAIALWSF